LLQGADILHGADAAFQGAAATPAPSPEFHGAERLQGAARLPVFQGAPASSELPEAGVAVAHIIIRQHTRATRQRAGVIISLSLSLVSVCE
jgi:hypothetical protein